MAVVTGPGPTTTYETQPSAVRSSAVSVELAGVLTILVGAWGALVPYVGPLIRFSADATAGWTWTSAHAWLFLVPGAVAVLGGLMMAIGGARRTGLARLGGVLAVLAGAWFVVGPVAWPILEGSSFFSGYTTLRQFDYWIGYSLGPGVLLLCFGAYVIGRPRPVRAPVQAASPAESTAPPAESTPSRTV